MNDNQKFELTRNELALLFNSVRKVICKVCLSTLDELGTEKTTDELITALKVMRISKDALSATIEPERLEALNPIYNETMSFLDDFNGEIMDTIYEYPTVEEAVEVLYRNLIEPLEKGIN